jgi:hypothetical protein
MFEAAVVIPVILIFSLSSLTRCVFGFGDAVVAMPLLSMVIGLRVATPLVVIVSFGMGLAMFIEYRQHIHFHSLWRIIVSAAAGIPLGIILLKGIDEAVMTLILGSLVTGFAVHSLISPEMKHSIKTNIPTYGLGFTAGLVGGAYNIFGPPIVVLGSLKKWDPDTFRATLQGFFIPMGIMLVIGHSASGLITRKVLLLAVFALPVTFLAFFVGTRIARRISADRFHTLVYWLVAGLGGLLIYQSVLELV